MQKLISGILAKKLYLVELLYFFTPLLVLNPSYLKDPQVVTHILYAYLGIISTRILLPLSKTKEKKRLTFYAKLIPTCFIIVVTTQLLQKNLLDLGFSFYLAFILVLVLEFKFHNRLIITFVKYFFLVFAAFFFYTQPQPTTVCFLSILLALIATALHASEAFLDQRTAFNWRLPGVLYLCFCALAGIMSILKLIHPLHFLLFFLVPFVIKFTPSKKSEPTPEKLRFFYKNSQIAFVAFFGIMLVIRVLWVS